MTRATVWGLAALAAVASAAGARPAPDQTAAGPALGACEGFPGARCGTYEVWEDRAAKTGRRIPLKIVVLPATGEKAEKDAIVFLAGGPGDPATRHAPGLAQAFRDLRRHRDIVLLDQRGTGGSHPLNCTLFEGDLQNFLGDFLPLDAVRRCRAELAKDADLALYTTSIAMDDLDEVRGALGYESLDVVGGSYGTRAALVYLRRYPERVRTAILLGVDPPAEPTVRAFGPDAQRALDGVLAECAAEAACHAAFPDLAGEVRALLDRLGRSPAPAPVVHPDTGETATVRLSRDLAAEALRYLLYQASLATLLPAIAHQAAQGDLTPLAEFALFGRREIVAAGSMGMYLSVTCAEDLPFIQPGEAERLAAGTFLGDYRLRQQRAACAEWVRGPVPADYREPVKGRAPVLLVTGQWDPVTPPALAEAAAATLTNALRVVVPHGGHDIEGLVGVDCVDKLQADLIERGTVEGLDTSCVGRIQRPPFPTVLPSLKPVAVAQQRLDAVAGRYAAEGVPFQATVESRPGRLRLSLPDRSFLLVPVSEGRFRIPGAFGLFVLFEGEGPSTTLVVEEGGQRTLTLPRAKD